MNRENCPVCGCKKTEAILHVNDWMFSDREFEKEYNYKKCFECGCLYREEEDIDYERLYDKDYSVFSTEEQLVEKSTIKRKLMLIRDSYVYMDRHKILGRILNQLRPVRYDYISEYKKLLKKGASFLDMGCGKGRMAFDLKEVGANVSGAEPYLEKSLTYPNGLCIQKKFITEIEEKYDIVFYDNVFEHLDFPLEDLLAVKKVLNSNGLCGLVFPGVGSMLKAYGKDTYIIQAPQHSCLHTEKSIEFIAQKAGYTIEMIKKVPVEAWYIKSFMLANDVPFMEGENLETLRGRLSDEAKNQIRLQVERAIKDNTGDMYHVILKKQEI